MRNYLQYIFVLGVSCLFGLFFLGGGKLPSKYSFVFLSILIFGPVFGLFFNSRKKLMGAFLFSLPISMGFCLFKGAPNPVSYVTPGFQLYLSDIFLGILFFISLNQAFQQRNLSRKKFFANFIWIPFFLWVLMCFFSFVNAVDYSRYFIGMLRMMRFFITIFCVYSFTRTRKEIVFVLKVLLWTLFFQALLIIMQFVTKTPIIQAPGLEASFDIVNGVFRPAGTMVHSSNFAKFSCMLLPCMMCFCFVRRSLLWTRVAWFVMGSIIVFALCLTLSRAGLVSLLISMILFYFALIKFRIVPINKTFLPIIMITSTVILAGGLLWNISGSQIVNRFIDDAGSLSARKPMWEVAVNISKANPWFGVGLLNYTLVHQEYDDTFERISSHDPVSVHNLFLLYSAEIGIVGTLAFCIFILALFKKSLFLAGRTKDPFLKMIWFSVFLGLLMLMLQSITGKGAVDHLIHFSVMACFFAFILKFDVDEQVR